MDLGEISAIGLASQVGTYILYTPEVEEQKLVSVSWRSGEGEEYLKNLKQRFSAEYFKKHISMPHPDLISYPAPRMLYFRNEMKNEYSKAEKILQPKDYIYYKLSGIFASDPYSWRGLANLYDYTFHDTFINEIGISVEKLLALFKPSESPGRLSGEAAEALGLISGMPVFAGCNDFFASLIGMGILDSGQCFDMTGTSEHIGMILDKPVDNTGLIGGPYIMNHIHYGVTANSGVSMDKTDGGELCTAGALPAP